MTEPTRRRTALYDTHVALGARMVEFAGWDMPVQYDGILAEHERVRKKVGLFDVSHMGEVRITGKDALAAANRLITNDLGRVGDGRAQYTALCHEDGTIVDDPSLIPAFKASGDWDEKHGLPKSQCLKCDPTLRIVRPPKV